MNKLEYQTPITSVVTVRPESSLLSLSDGGNAQAPNVQQLTTLEIISEADW